eukprot:CAMPEP_0185003944 /NCGR_PEP_ID=MMETSP1098-20130426/77911_1 /TAXON_ID=89044 /ORGANISM="Spumella elongata, Strain CCAP 955/1" /LENGTH=55 /DNA_ID=CAMNT_0027531677 /DNA_START=104 /DNA_END=268 /DNA_ORIENTATION=+
MTESRLGSMSTISGEEMENDSGTVSPYTHSLDEIDTELINFLELLHASLSTDPSP